MYVPSLVRFAQSALPGALPFSFPSWNTVTPMGHGQQLCEILFRFDQQNERTDKKTW